VCIICKQYGGDPDMHLRMYGHTPVIGGGYADLGWLVS